MTTPLIVFGCGGHGKVVADAAQSTGRRVLGFADDSPQWRSKSVLGLPVLSIGRDETRALCKETGAELILAIGDNRIRARVFDAMRADGFSMSQAVVHASASVAASASIAAGTVVFAKAVVNPDSSVGENAILNTGVCVDHDAQLGAHCHLSPGVVLGGAVTVGTGTHLGVGVAVRNNVSIGAWSVVGVGASVVGNIPDGVVAHGVPARVVRRI